MNIMVAADNNWAIGNHNELLVSIPADQKLLHRETAGKIVVMGRKTLQKFPNGLPLPGRINIILTGNTELKAKDAILVHSVEALMKELEKYNTEDVYVLGGESVYRQLLPYCSVVHVTRIDKEYAADAYFSDLDQNPEWKITANSEEQTYFDIPYEFVRYERIP